jgi:hypothetical protein
MGGDRPSIFNPRLYFVARIIMLKFHGNRSTGIKVIARKHTKNTIFNSFGPLVNGGQGHWTQFWKMTT